MPNPPAQVRVGVAAFVLEHSASHPPRFLVGIRQGSHGAGKLALPGGHLECNETFEQCAAREVREETGLQVRDVEFLTATNDIMEGEGRHYVTVFMTCARADGAAEARTMEPEKCEGWKWMAWGELRGMVERGEEGRLFVPLVNLVRERSDCVSVLQGRE